MIFTNDDEIAKACCEIRVHGQSKHYLHTRVGVGGRMDTLQCVMVLAKLERFNWEVSLRLEIGETYNKLVVQYGLQRVQQRRDRTSVFEQYTIFVDQRATVQKFLEEAGIPTAFHYPIPMNHQPAYQHLCCPDLCQSLCATHPYSRACR